MNLYKSFKLNDNSYVVYNTINRREVYLGLEEYNFFLLLSEGNSISDVIRKSSFSEMECYELMRLFSKHGLIDSKEHTKQKNVIKYISLWNPLNKPLYLNDRKRSFFFILFSLVFSIQCYITMFKTGTIFHDILESASNSSTISLMFSLAISSLVHEIGHAYIARRLNYPVAEIGVRTVLFIPIGLYTTICGLKKDKMGWDTFLVSAAGVLANLFFSALIIVVLTYTKLNNIFLLNTVFANILLIGINFLSLYPFDGFFMLKGLSKIRKIRFVLAIRIALLLLVFLLSFFIHYGSCCRYIFLLYFIISLASIVIKNKVCDLNYLFTVYQMIDGAALLGLFVSEAFRTFFNSNENNLKIIAIVIFLNIIYIISSLIRRLLIDIIDVIGDSKKRGS